jgi:Fur family transcriptional regulator, ferric uptake regulator
MVSKKTLFTTILKSNGYSVTRAREVVFTALLEADHPVSLAELQKNIAKIDRSSIYRVIDLFAKLNIVHKIQITWKDKYELSEIFLPHHHHIFCEQCGAVKELEFNRELEQKINEYFTNSGYINTHHHLEATGVCAECRRKG